MPGWDATGDLRGHAWGSLLQAYELAADRPPPRLDVRQARELPFSGLRPAAAVLLVASELSHTPVPSGGIGTFTVQLARDLSSAGYAVTILFTRWEDMSASEREEVEATFDGWGVRVVGLPLFTPGANRFHLRQSYRVLQFLLQHGDAFAAVHFHEYGGLGFLPLLAKAQGWAIPRAATLVGLHGSSAWATYVNGHMPHGDHALSLLFCERRAVELADVVWSPSEYMAGYVQSRKWTTRQPIYIAQYPVGSHLLSTAARPSSGPLPPIRGRHELVFFGRLELRKGLAVFVSALAAAAAVTGPFPVTFLGRNVIDDGYGDMRTWAAAQLESSGLNVTFLSDLSSEQATDYLRSPGRVACMPSLVDNSPLVVYEALALGVPFLSSTTGGIAELVHPDDVAAVLLPPTVAAWTRKMVAVVTGSEPVHRAAPRHPHAAAPAVHRALLEHALSGQRRAHAPPASLPSPLPLVSVIIATHNRVGVIQQTLDALAAQTYPRRSLEIIVVDDGSTDAHAVEVLQEISRRLKASGTGRVLTIANQYLGAARNRGAEVARGEYLAFIDDDDVPVADYVERLVRVAAHTRSDILSTFFANFDGDGAPSADTPHSLYMFVGQALSTALVENAFGGANIFIRRAAFEAVGRFSELVSVGYEDYELLVRASLRRLRHDVVPAALLWVRRSPMSMSQSVSTELGMMRVAAVVQAAFSDAHASLDVSDLIAHVVGAKLAADKAVDVLAEVDTEDLVTSDQGVYNLHYGAVIAPLLPGGAAVDAVSKFPPTLQRWAAEAAHAAAAAGVECRAAGVGGGACALTAATNLTAHMVWDAAGAPPAWRAPSFASTSWPFITAFGMHPGVTGGSALLPMLTWRSFFVGRKTVTVSYDMGDQGCGDGVCLALLHNGEAVWRVCNAAPSGHVVSRTQGSAVLQLQLTTASALTLIVDPLGSEDCDSVRTSMAIEQ
jgi:glycosyltransferase involved in cell wall biosynthesis/GT2 family glycosyltransferase